MGNSGPKRQGVIAVSVSNVMELGEGPPIVSVVYTSCFARVPSNLIPLAVFRASARLHITASCVQPLPRLEKHFI